MFSWLVQRAKLACVRNRMHSWRGGGGQLSVAVLGTWNHGQGNRGGNSERDHRRKWKRGVWGWRRVLEGVLCYIPCVVSSCALLLIHSCILTLLCQAYKIEVKDQRIVLEEGKRWEDVEVEVKRQVQYFGFLELGPFQVCKPARCCS